MTEQSPADFRDFSDAINDFWRVVLGWQEARTDYDDDIVVETCPTCGRQPGNPTPGCTDVNGCGGAFKPQSGR